MESWVGRKKVRDLVSIVVGLGAMLNLVGVARGQVSYEVVHSFNTGDGANPYAGLIQASDGNFYGTTVNGGAAGVGTVFQLTPSGTLTTLHSFNTGDGANPYASLIQASDGDFYGTTLNGGTAEMGTVFKMTPSGALTTLHSFNPVRGANPSAGVIQASDGNFYGTTQIGGTGGRGTVFKMTSSGILTTLHSFNGPEGATPYSSLIQASDGHLYGTTLFGGSPFRRGLGSGTVFRITLSGSLTTVHSFNVIDGVFPIASLVQANNGNFYGTTSGGGKGEVGTVFQLTPSGKLTTLVDFIFFYFLEPPYVCFDLGAFPRGTLIQASDGNFYSTTSEGGPCGGDVIGTGTVFKMTPSGELTTLHSFFNTGDGANPAAGLIQASDGSFYGTTRAGGSAGAGVVFRFVSSPPAK